LREFGKVATEMGPYTTASAAASGMAKATAGMAPGPRIATVSLIVLELILQLNQQQL